MKQAVHSPSLENTAPPNEKLMASFSLDNCLARFYLSTKSLSFIIGILYVVFIGFFKIGSNLQATLFHLTIFSLIFLMGRSRNLPFEKYHKLLMGLGAFLSVFLSVTTNSLMLDVTSKVVWVITLILSIYIFEGRSQDSLSELVGSSLRYSKYYILNILSLTSLSSYMRFKAKNINFTLRMSVASGLLLSIPVMLIFHVLFLGINQEYVKFTSDIFYWIQKIISFIFEIDIFRILLQGLVQGYLFFVFLTLSRSHDQDEEFENQWKLVTFKIIIFGVASLFFIFSSFQAKLLFQDIAKLTFTVISQYVQKGFLELIVVSFLGYCLIQFILRRIAICDEQSRSIKQILTVFSLQLVAVSVFMAHKLYVLQSTFGLKDQRILATGLTLIILLTFISTIFQIYQKITAKVIFRSQVLSFSIFILCLNIFPTDMLVSQLGAPKYFVDQSLQKDFAYIVGNSYDNLGFWESHMGEAMTTKIAKPDRNYYWGYFSSAGVDSFGSNYLPICVAYTEDITDYPPYGPPVDKIILKRQSSYLEYKLQRLSSKYQALEKGGAPLTDITQFNFREWQAYQLIKENSELVAKYIEYAKSVCK